MKPWKNRLLVAAVAPLVLAGCKTTGAKIAASAFTGSGTAFARDSDPELVKDAAPFALKTMESLLDTLPDDVELLTALTANFTQYAYAFVQQDADVAEMEGRTAEARAGRERARKLFLRARDYGLRALDERYPGIAARLRTARDLGPALAKVKAEDAPLLYWTAAAWAMAISDGKSDMQLVSELPAPVAMMRRGLELDEGFDRGAFHEFFVTYEGGRSVADGGGPEVARRHLERALALSGGKRLGVQVAWAETVLVQEQDRAAFEKALRDVLAFDVDSAPEFRLANVLAQRRARALLGHTDDLFAWNGGHRENPT
ncbi:MAG TPA: TRAP transporter TatT component family protein [Anaeromyxobacteraceae bacterium]|nr:TRAP transporter TatT component family protein [Anaeromyxobacteraceae bacterium]